MEGPDDPEERIEALKLSVARFLSDLAWREGERDRAVERARASAAIAHELGWSWWESHTQLTLAEFERERERPVEAAGHGGSALTLALVLEDRMTAVFSVAELALQAAARGDAATAGRLWGAIEAEVASAPVGQWARNRDGIEAKVLGVDGPEFGRARDEGRLLTLSAAAELPELLPQTEP